MIEVSGDLPYADKTVDEICELINDARYLWDRRKLADSEPLLRRALELSRTFGADNPVVALVLSHWGWLASARKQHNEAVAAYREALAIRERRLGAGHLETLRAMEQLAAALFEVKARDEAIDALGVRAISGYEAVGRDDVELADLVANVAWRRYFVGRYADAEPLFLRALAMYERLLGPNDPRTAEAARRLAVMYDWRAFDKDPEPYFRRALSGFEAAHGSDHKAVFAARYRLARFLALHDRMSEAAPLFEQLIETLRRCRSKFEPGDIRWMLDDCCQYLRATGRESEAEDIEECDSTSDYCLERWQADASLAEAGYGADSLELAESLGHLANAYASLGRGDNAEEAAQRALAIFEVRLGADHPTTVEAAAGREHLRAMAASWSAIRGRRRVRRSRPSRFEPFSAPWRDARRTDLIRSYLAEIGKAEDDDTSGAALAITAMGFLADQDEQWKVILELIAAAPDDARVLGAIAAGPMERFLGRFNETVIDRVRDEAARNRKHRRVLTGVWKHTMTDAVWEQVRAIQATADEALS